MVGMRVRKDRPARRSVIPVLAGAVATVTLSAGPLAASAWADNGIGSMSATQAVAASVAAIRQAPNLVITGLVSERGATLGLHIESARKGTDAAGTLVSHSATLGFFGTVHFVTIGPTFYIEGGSTFWERIFAAESGLTAAQRQKILAVIVNQWIELPPSDAKSVESEFSGFTNPASLASELTSSTGKLTKGTPQVVHGVDALPIHSSKGGTLWLSLNGPPLPVELTGGTSSSHADLAFAYPATLNITAPAGAKTLAQIEAAAG